MRAELVIHTRMKAKARQLWALPGSRNSTSLFEIQVTATKFGRCWSIKHLRQTWPSSKLILFSAQKWVTLEITRLSKTHGDSAYPLPWQTSGRDPKHG